MLIDANIILEITLGQAKQKPCTELIDAIKSGSISEEIFISRFSLSAIEALTRDRLPEFLRDFLLLIHNGLIQVCEHSVQDDLAANTAKKDLGLDFDDTLQFLTAGRLGTYLVTYDEDFATTSLQTKTPEEVIEELTA